MIQVVFGYGFGNAIPTFCERKILKLARAIAPPVCGIRTRADYPPFGGVAGHIFLSI